MTVSILMYHSIGEDAPRHQAGDGAFYTVTSASFERHLRQLHNSEVMCVGLDDLLTWHLQQREVPDRTVVLTFDDGDATHATRALPAMRAAGVTGTFFIVPALVGRPGYVTWDQVRALRDAGMTIGSHGLTHAHLTELDVPAIRDELVHSKQQLESELQHAVRFFSAPGGFYDETVRSLVREAGYAAACTSRIDWVHRHDDPYDWARFAVRAGWTTAHVRAVIHKDHGLAWRLRVARAGAAVARTALGVRRYEAWKTRWLSGQAP